MKRVLVVAQRLQVSLVSEQAVERWAKRTRLFFVVGHGRSGTAFFARLLNEAQDAVVVHEPCRLDHLAYADAFHNEDKSRKYVQLFRKKEIVRRVGKMMDGTYGEVNSVLRRHVRALREAFPRATFLHLIRDGRDVVRSMAARSTMLDENMDIHPNSADPWLETWDQLSRFEKLCWYWQVENRHVREAVGRTVKFEKLVGSYAYFHERLLTPLGLDIPEQTWREACVVPENVTSKHSMPRWREWDSSQRSQFEKICGEEMAANGYSSELVI